MSWANNVLPVFMAASGKMPGRLPELAFAVQIDTTPHRSGIRFNHGFQRIDPSFNRTVGDAPNYPMIGLTEGQRFSA